MNRASPKSLKFMSVKKKPNLKIVVLGPPGSGKGTQAEFLSKIFKIPRFAAGDLLRAEAKKKTARGRMVKKLVDAGKLVPHQITDGLIKEKILKTKNGVLIDGYPRDLPQLYFLKKYFTPDLVISLKVSKNELIKRLSGRRTCEKCGAIYHLVYKKSKKKNVCDVCGGKLLARADETPKAIKQRLLNYKNQCVPVINWYRKNGNLLEINGDKSIKEVSKELGIRIKKFWDKD